MGIRDIFKKKQIVSSVQYTSPIGPTKSGGDLPSSATTPKPASIQYTTPAGPSRTTSSGGGGSSGSAPPTRTLSPVAQAALNKNTTNTSAAIAQQAADRTAIQKAQAAINERERLAIINETNTTRPASMVTATPQPTTTIGKARKFISEKRSQLTTESFRDSGDKPLRSFGRQFQGKGLGVLYSGISTIEFVANPIKSTKDIYLGGKELFTNPMARQGAREELTRTIREEPGFALGFVGGEVLTAKGIGAVAKAGKEAKIAGIPTEFAGVSTPAGDITKTSLAFRLPTGQRGIAKAITKTNSAGISETLVGGRFGTPGVVFPSGKQVIRKVRTFGTQELSKGDSVNAAFLTEFDDLKIAENLESFSPMKEASIGSTVVTKARTIAEGGLTRTPFLSRGLSLKQGDRVNVFTDIFTLDKKIREARGTIILKSEKKTTSSLGSSGSTSGLSEQTLQDISASIGSVQDIKSSIATPSFIPAPKSFIQTGEIKTPTTTTQVTKTATSVSPVVKEKVKTTQSIKVNTIVSTGTRSKPTTAQAIRQAQSPNLKAEQKTITNERVKSIQSLSFGTAQKQKQRQLLKTISQMKQTTRFPPISIRPRVVKPPKVSRPKKTSVSNYLFGVQVRRQGKFRSVGTKLSLQKAQTLGRERVSRTLGATYKITGAIPMALRTPKGFYSKYDKKEGLLFIEKRSKKLSKVGEVKEIQQARKRKKKKRGFFDEY